MSLTVSASELIQRARDSFLTAGGAFDGDETAGSFSLVTPLGTIAGKYTLADGSLNIALLSKPILVSCNRVRQEIVQRLGL